MTNRICQSCKSKGRDRVETGVYYVMGSAKRRYKCPVCHKVVD